MQDNNLIEQGKALYNKKEYSQALAFFLGLPTDAEVDKIDVAYYLGLCYTKLEKYDDALLFLEQVVTSGTQLERVLQCRFLLVRQENLCRDQMVSASLTAKADHAEHGICS